MYIECTSPGDGQTSCKVWLASVERRRCSNEAKTRNPLKFSGVPNEPISAASGPKFTILSGHAGEIGLLLFNDNNNAQNVVGEFSEIAGNETTLEQESSITF